MAARGAVGLLLVKPRLFARAVDTVTVRTLYGQDALALLLEWDDPSLGLALIPALMAAPLWAAGSPTRPIPCIGRFAEGGGADMTWLVMFWAGLVAVRSSANAASYSRAKRPGSSYPSRSRRSASSVGVIMTTEEARQRSRSGSAARG